MATEKENRISLYFDVLLLIKRTFCININSRRRLLILFKLRRIGFRVFSIKKVSLSRSGWVCLSKVKLLTLVNTIQAYVYCENTFSYLILYIY